MHRFTLAIVIVTLLGITAASASTPTSRSSDAVIEAQCRRYFRGVCSEALGRWLPGSFNASWTWMAKATHVETTDEFTYETTSTAERYLDSGGPRDGTAFEFGSAGPPRGHAVYDPVHRIAFYDVGCCSWHEIIETSNVAPPPDVLVERNLLRVKTFRGAALGQHPADILKLYGFARLQPVRGYPEVRVLSYRGPFSVSGSQPDSGCGTDQNFFFRHGRVIEIQIGRAC